VCNGQPLEGDERFVKQAESEYLTLAKSTLGDEANISKFLVAHQKAHCAVLKETRDSKWFENEYGMSALMAAQLTGGAATLSFGTAATMFGCVPCLPIAIVAGGSASVAGYLDAERIQARADTVRGLANINLAEHEDARSLLREAELGWIFVGVDLVLTPLGLKGGALIKAGKNISKGRKALKGTELAKNKNFFKAIVNGLPEDEYFKVVEELAKLSPAELKIIATDLAKLEKLDKATRITMIEKVLTQNGVNFPGDKILNNAVLRRIDNSLVLQEKIKNDYANEMLSIGINPGSAEEKAFIRIAGILEEKGCAGTCAKNLVKKKEVMKRYEESSKRCKG
jgi:hypothetical protein